jgi:hypothetical protein
MPVSWLRSDRPISQCSSLMATSSPVWTSRPTHSRGNDASTSTGLPYRGRRVQMCQHPHVDAIGSVRRCGYQGNVQQSRLPQFIRSVRVDVSHLRRQLDLGENQLRSRSRQNYFACHKDLAGVWAPATSTCPCPVVFRLSTPYVELEGRTRLTALEWSRFHAGSRQNAPPRPINGSIIASGVTRRELSGLTTRHQRRQES